MMEITREKVLAFEAYMRERFGIEPGVDADGTHYYERWQIEKALEREVSMSERKRP